MEKRPKKWLLLTTLLVLLVGVAAFYLNKKQTTASAGSQPAKTVEVKKGSIQEKVHALGTVGSAEMKLFKADAAETIQDVKAQIGEQVKAGQDFITFKGNDLSGSILDAKSNVQAAEIDAESAQRDLATSNANRSINSPVSGKVLEISGAIGEDVQDNTVLATIQDSIGNKVEVQAKASGKIASLSLTQGAEVQQGAVLATLEKDQSLQDKAAKAEIQLQQAKAKLNQLQANEQIPSLKSPFSGTVVDVKVQPGDTVQKGDPLVEVADLTNMQMTLSVDELDILKIKNGQNVEVRLNAMPTSSLTGVVASISNIGEVLNGVSTFSVAVKLNTVTDVKPGMTGEAYITTSEKKDILLLPLEAIQEKNGHPFVMVQSTDGKQQLTKVKTGIHDDQFVEIVSGVQEGEKVVIPKSYTLDKNNKKKNNNALKKMFGGGNKQGKQK
ncbi:efflux RND transporter periplasmic adaptor subunit [Neobacillus sp. SM06]|uniref:efflux RND transporter periplasmic adaptor subunit n=1 Tax=Neobacillus sp. SM06 TaxID=3422492 RepID=UPI003D2BFBA9